MRNSDWLMIPALVVPSVLVAPAYAVQYLTAEQTQHALFPEAASFERADINLTPEMQDKIAQASGVRVRNAALQVWRAEAGGKTLGWMVVDEVIGKHEFITYAVALLPDGSVKGIDIMDYRETHGGQVRNEKWRAQFSGKKFGDTIKLNEDIQNISGATLSCKNISNGVKRILATFRMVQQ